jgi:hypothetical protein
MSHKPDQFHQTNPPCELKSVVLGRMGTKKRKPSKERGCDGKMKITSDYTRGTEKALQMSIKHGKQFGMYLCPHCDHHHLTTKLDNAKKYTTPLVYITPTKTMSHTPDQTDKYIKFEVIDRAATMSTMLDQLLTGHVGLKNGRLQELHDNAERALGELHQEAAQYLAD